MGVLHKSKCSLTLTRLQVYKLHKTTSLQDLTPMLSLVEPTVDGYTPFIHIFNLTFIIRILKLQLVPLLILLLESKHT